MRIGEEDQPILIERWVGIDERGQQIRAHAIARFHIGATLFTQRQNVLFDAGHVGLPDEAHCLGQVRLIVKEHNCQLILGRQLIQERGNRFGSRGEFGFGFPSEGAIRAAIIIVIAGKFLRHRAGDVEHHDEIQPFTGKVAGTQP